jgi:TP901 family phage tail tape measure protein
MNITVRVLVAQARAALAQLRSSVGGVGFGGAAAGATAFGNALGGMRIDRFGSQMQWLGRQIEYNFTLPLVAAGAAVMKMALDNEKALVRIQKVYGDAGHDANFYASEIKALEKAFVALSNQFGISQSETLNIAADWAAAGASGLALAKAVQLTLKTMVLGEMDAADATRALISIQAQYGFTVDELTKTIAVLNMVENQTGTSMKDLVEGFSRAAGVAKAMGVGVRELAADIAALTPATGTAANAGNALKTIFSRMMSTTQDAAEVLKLMGINTLGFSWQAANAQDKLIMMAHAFHGLSDAQQGFVSSIIASRYQVNRFEVLMSALLDPLGYYQRALDATADSAAVYRQAQKELDAVLTSSPQRLKILWTTMQNAAADIIQPMIPLVLWLATALQKLVQGFSNLDPGIQKFILFGLAIIAVVGPIIRYIGAFQILIFELGGLFKLLWVPIAGATSMLWNFIRVPVVAALALWEVGLRGFIGFFGILPSLIRGGLVAAAAVFEAGVWLFPRIYRGAVISMYLISQLTWTNITAFFGRFLAGMQALAIAGMTRLGVIWRTGLTLLQGALLAFATISGNTWRVITLLPLVATRTMFVNLIALFTNFIPTIRAASTAVMAAMTGPWGIAISAIVVLIAVFWKQIKQMFENGVKWFTNSGKSIGNAFMPIGKAAQAVRNMVISAFNALPSGIQNALMAVVRTVAAAAKAVYSWFSYLNPWARHSPSLVDNVTTGVAEIKRQYASLTDVGSAFANAGADLKLFAAAVAAVNRSAEANHYAEIRAELVKVAGDAVGPFDRLIKELYQLEDQLNSVKDAMDAQQAVVDALKTQLDSANDALNTQKDLLQQMKDEADNYSDRISRINGDLEVLTGTREALRQVGAGSDILGPMDDQIKMLKDQKKGINDQLDAAQKAYNDQKKLVDDLTAARDKLQASYDLEKQKLDQINDAYGKIRDRISDITGAIQDFQSSIDALNAGAGKADDVANAFNAGAGANFADVGGSGGIGREGGIGDQASQIDDFTKQLQDETKKMFGMFNFLDPIKKAWNKAWDWVKSTFGPLANLVGNFFAHLIDNVPNPFAGIGKDSFSGFTDGIKSLLDGIKGFGEAIWRLIGQPLSELWTAVKDALGGALDKIAPQITKFKDLWEPLQKLWLEIVPILKILGAIIGGVLVFAFTLLVDILKNVVGPIINWLIDLIAGIIRVLRGVIEFIVGVFTGDWSLAWKGIVDIFGGLWDIIWSTLKNAVLLIWGVIKGLVEGIVDFFVWLWDELVGHSIIPDIINGIMEWFQKGADFLQGIMKFIVGIISWVWTNVIQPQWNAISALWTWLMDKIGEGIDRWKGYFNIAVAVLVYLHQIAVDKVNAMKDKFLELVDRIKDVVNNIKTWIDNVIEKFLGIGARLKFDGIFDSLKNAFKNAMNWIIGKWNNLSFSAGPFSVDTPNIPMLARGGKTNGVAIVGEGNPNYGEYVIPTDPAYRKRAWMLMDQLAGDLGVRGLLGSGQTMKAFSEAILRGVSGDKVQFFASGGILGGTKLRGSGRGGVVVVSHSENAEYHFHGDLSFPNIKDGSDAEAFIDNLRALVGK